MYALILYALIILNKKHRTRSARKAIFHSIDSSSRMVLARKKLRKTGRQELGIQDPATIKFKHSLRDIIDGNSSVADNSWLNMMSSYNCRKLNIVNYDL